MLLCSSPAGYLVAASEQPQTQKIENSAKDPIQTQEAKQAVLPEDLAPDYNDPDYVKMQMPAEQTAASETPFSLRSIEAVTTKSPYTGLVYTHGAQFSDGSIIDGIDVSKWQADIDWKKVKAAGVKFVFIRCGYTALSKDFAMYEDEYFRKNIEGAYQAGISVGIYFFSNSITTNEAKKEAQKTLDLIKNYKSMITLPVVYDFEAFSNAYRAYGLSKEQVTKNTIAYADIIQDAGYTPMYYGSPNFLGSSFDVAKLTAYDCWQIIRRRRAIRAIIRIGSIPVRGMWTALPEM